MDVESESGYSVGTAVEPDNERFYPAFWLSPDGRTAALVRPIAVPYNLASAWRMGLPVPLELRSLDGGKVTLDRPLPDNVHAMTLQWSPDGKELAFFANGPGPVDPVRLYGAAAAAAMPLEHIPTRGNPAQFYRVNIAEGTIVPWRTGEIDLGEMGSPRFFWTAKGEIVVSAPRRQYGAASGSPASRGAPWGVPAVNALPIGARAPTSWWVIGRNGETRPLASNGGSPLPASLQPVDGGAWLVGVRNGDVWRIDPNTGLTTNTTARFGPHVVSILKEFSAGPQLIVRAAAKESEDRALSPTSPRQDADQHYRIDLLNGTITSLPRLGQDASLVAFAPRTHSAAYLVNSRQGTSLWRTDSNGRQDLLVETNTYVRDIEEPNCQLISYTSLNGDPLKGRLCLPTGYVAGRRYPLVLDVYYGITFVDDGQLHPREEALFSSAGYVYLAPSIPPRLPDTLPEEGDSPALAINGILPAVERAISLDIIDPNRLFIYGQSRGGWTVLHTIAQSTRFKAAVSRAYGDNARLGTLDPYRHLRYSESYPMQFIDPSGGYRKGERPSDVPWWRDGDQLRRNHPLSFVDRVQTPVMLIHGDLDPAPFEASEEYFYALVSMRKPAEFVRYWGEGHGNKIPANIRDQFQRMFAWFDRWGDITRDAHGELVFDGDRVRSRNGAPPLTPEYFARVGPAAPTLAQVVTSH